MFVFAACQPGAENLLKTEVSKRYPAWKPSFSRPGWVSWRNDGAVPAWIEPPVLAWVWGEALAKGTREEIPTRLAEALAGPLASEKGRLRLSVSVRGDNAGDIDGTGPEMRQSLNAPPEPAPEKWTESELETARAEAQALEAELRASPTLGSRFLPAEPAVVGDRVIEVVYLDPGHWVIGTRVQNRWDAPWGFGKFGIELPEEAPSRAYLKIAQAMRLAGVAPRNGQMALEIGSAPGGATYYLLTTRTRVIGVDPAAMDESLERWIKKGHLTHIESSIVDVKKQDLPGSVDWLVVDMNCEPLKALETTRRLFAQYRTTLRGAFLTLKMNTAHTYTEIPVIRERLGKLGMKEIHLRQLPANRSEISAILLGNVAP